MSKRYVDHYAGPRKQDRRTPKYFFDSLNRHYHFTLDGACTKRNALLAVYSTRRNPQSWSGHRVFCNPPWSNIRPFVEMAAHADFALLLVPARVNAKWFHRALKLGGRPKYWEGKLNFGGPFNSPIDCLLLLFGKE